MEALQIVRRRRCHRNLKTDDKVGDPLVACRVLKQAKCNKTSLSPASVQPLHWSITHCSGAHVPPWLSCAEACWTLVYPGSPVSRASCVCTWVHITFICFWIGPNEADLILHTDYTTAPHSSAVNRILL